MSTPEETEALDRLAAAITGGQVRVTFGPALAATNTWQSAMVETRDTNGRWTKVKPLLVDDTREALLRMLAALTDPDATPASTD